MSDTDKVFYPNKNIEQILGKPKKLSPEEITKIDAKAEKATERFRKMVQELTNNEENHRSGTIPKSSNPIISDEGMYNIDQDAKEAADRFIQSFRE